MIRWKYSKILSTTIILHIVKYFQAYFLIFQGIYLHTVNLRDVMFLYLKQ